MLRCCPENKILVLASRCHDGEAACFHVLDLGNIGHNVCGMAVGIVDAEMPWEGVIGAGTGGRHFRIWKCN